MTLPAEPASVARARRFANAAMDGAAVDHAAVLLAVSELVSNAVMHAYPNGAGAVELTVTQGGGWIDVSVRDQGVGFTGADGDGGGAGAGPGIVASLAASVSRSRVDGETTVSARFPTG